MCHNWRNLSKVSAWVSPYTVFEPVFIEEYKNDQFVARVFNRTPIGEHLFVSRKEAESFAGQDGRMLIEEHVDPLFIKDGNDIRTGQTFEYWFKDDAATPYYVILNMTPGEKITVQSLMGDNRPIYVFDSYKHARIALWQDIYKRVDELDLDETR